MTFQDIRFNLNIENTDNQAYTDDPIGQTCDLLEGIVKKLEQGTLSGKLRDPNGNTVGNWSLNYETIEGVFNHDY